MKSIIEFFRMRNLKQGLKWSKIQDEIGEPPWEYNFLYNLPESEYPKYLAKIFNYRTGEKLPLKWDFKNQAWIIDKKKCKTFNQKIQWIKLYGVTSLMRDCADKVKVRDYVKEKIGEEYLKPVLQIIPNESQETVCCHCEQVNDNSGLARQSTDRCNHILDCHADIKMSSSARLRFPKFQFRENWVLAEYNDRKSDDVSTYFDQIDFDKLPDSFVLKCNHGSKWQYIIKNKNEFLNTKPLFELVKRNITGYLEQEFWVYEGFELQYKGIEPKILIEPLMRDDINIPSEEIQIYICSGEIKLIVRIEDMGITLYDKNFNIINEVLSEGDKKNNKPFDKFIKQTFDLSYKLINEFNFVRVFGYNFLKNFNIIHNLILFNKFINKSIYLLNLKCIYLHIDIILI